MIDANEFLVIQTAESVLIALGLGVLFFAITLHRRGRVHSSDEQLWYIEE